MPNVLPRHPNKYKGSISPLVALCLLRVAYLNTEHASLMRGDDPAGKLQREGPGGTLSDHRSDAGDRAVIQTAHLPPLQVDTDLGGFTFLEAYRYDDIARASADRLLELVRIVGVRPLLGVQFLRTRCRSFSGLSATEPCHVGDSSNAPSAWPEKCREISPPTVNAYSLHDRYLPGQVTAAPRWQHQRRAHASTNWLSPNSTVDRPALSSDTTALIASHSCGAAYRCSVTASPYSAGPTAHPRRRASASIWGAHR